MGQINACQTVCSSSKINRIGRETLECQPQVMLIAWLRRRNGPDCRFGSVFVELFGNREPVGLGRFNEVLTDRGFHGDVQGVFTYLDRFRRTNLIGAAEFEAFQAEIEDREAAVLKLFRSFLKRKFNNPSAVFKEMGKGEGDVFTQAEFVESLRGLGFTIHNPAELFRFMDKDFSGELTFSEFRNVMAKLRSRGHSPRTGRSPTRSPRGNAPTMTATSKSTTRRSPRSVPPLSPRNSSPRRKRTVGSTNSRGSA
mmetsp:Transcript_32647/g.75894  ORF Transcript_32647/g.75894 Transcript_32647/m.75894 type:complete len:254 (-) Transcript_32647:166-927(-)